MQLTSTCKALCIPSYHSESYEALACRSFFVHGQSPKAVYLSTAGQDFALLTVRLGIQGNLQLDDRNCIGNWIWIY